MSSDLAANDNYYLGIVIALCSAALDTVLYFIIRKIGNQIPKSLYPFLCGIYTTFIMLVFTEFYDPLDWFFFFKADYSDEDLKYRTALLLSLIGCVISWFALEFMVIGLRISKSALASYGEMVGITVPFIYDGLFMGRSFLSIDALGLTLIIAL